ncbi:MAG TPA: DNA polymerase III subunit delta [Kiloniellales bacterium]|nr:DNA polymerase III subunit delta [Kiloniellales bacterium]
MELKSALFSGQLNHLLPKLRFLLFYGPDAGLVAELAEQAVRAVLGEDKDPFRLAELSARQLREDPALLADEAAALAFTGGRRVVRLREIGNDLAKQLAAFVTNPVGEALVVAEAGDLPKRSDLVKAITNAGEHAAVVACYRDEGGGLARFAESVLREANLGITPQALSLLASQLGGDRQLSRREIEKLILYKGEGRVELEDVRACIGDGAALDLDDLALAVAEGDAANLDRILRRSLRQGASAVQILRQVMRHFQRLQFVAGHLAEGGSAEAAMNRLQPRPFWKIAKRFEGQARRWPPARLSAASARLLEAEAACKRTGANDAVLCAQVLLGIVMSAPKIRR